MTHVSRRLALVAGVSALAGCGIVGTSKTSGVTTITINTASVATWAQAFRNAANLISTLPGIVGTPTSLAIGAISTLVAADAAAFATASGGKLSLTFDGTSVPASLSSLLADGQKLLAATQAALGSVASTATTQAQMYVNALATIVSIFEAAMGAAPVGAAPGRMDETAALGTLGVRK